ncbi:type III effector protein [Streptomyces sp. P9(2023)]|uniref:type III effector protein n=1 Tax=Streptomyces sp. P9(2023) TaxID=3064394 RepID=UPI0028F449B4|nr:type III effector protein [Streptomyces sp. P9(2023)]MDT9688927.1 type III effector protein [Streptomyces sp. P9(2023)]
MRRENTQGEPGGGNGDARRASPESLLAATAALDVISAALRAARIADPGATNAEPGDDGPGDDGPGDDGQAENRQIEDGPGRALASLLLLREVRDELGTWESHLIEAARRAGASWADLAHPLGVASRQAAERRYLRLRPGADGSTAEQRVKATRDRRAADRAVVIWARGHAADLRRLAGQITALTDLPEAARAALADLDRALAEDDAAALVAPLAAARDHLRATRPDLAESIDRLILRAEQLRRDSTDQRGTT